MATTAPTRISKVLPGASGSAGSEQLIQALRPWRRKLTTQQVLRWAGIGFVTGLILQRQTGANMVSVLENLSTLVRERLNMAAKMKAHTAQQRFSAGLLCCLPLVVGIGFWILKPDYVRLLWTDPTGIKFFTYAICSEIVGILIIR